MSKEELLKNNGWKKVLPLLEGDDLFFPGKELVYPGDMEYIKDKVCMFNDDNDLDYENKFIVSIPPEPWSSNILSAKIVILSLNPGFVLHLNKDLACMFRSEAAKEILEDKRAILKMQSRRESMPSRVLGEYYWMKSLKHLGQDIYGLSSEWEKILDDVAYIQVYAYASVSKINIGKDLLPSQLFTREVISYIAQNNPNTKFLLFRAEKEWTDLMGMKLWNDLTGGMSLKRGSMSGRILKSNNYRTQYVTPDNIGHEIYEEIKKTIKEN